MPYEQKWDVRSEESAGMEYDVDSGTMQPFHRVDHAFIVPTYERSSPAPFQGDHRTAYDYGMGTARILTDSPVVKHSYYDNPVDHLTSNYDYRSTEYLSKWRLPFSQSTIDQTKMENAISKAITSALQSLKGQSANWGSDLGEMKEGANSIAKLIPRGVSFIRHMRRGQWGRAADALGISKASFYESSNRGRVLAHYWLAYVYGWRPYAQSLYDAQQTVADIVNRNSNNIEATGTGKCEGGVDDFYYGNIRQKSSWRGSARCTLKATISMPGLHNMNKLGLTNPLSVAWELVPFSFCVDWFVPIGNVLDALGAAQGLDFHGGWFNVRQKERIRLFLETGRQDDWTTVENGGDYLEEQFTFNRTALAAFPLPRLHANLKPFSTPRVVNAIALVRSIT